jgi:hypothetical protein
VVSFRRLKVGDWIRITAIPPEFLRPDKCFPRETRQLYERLIRLRRQVKVSWIDDFGYPYISYRHRDARNRLLWHGLMIGEHDIFVRVLRAGERRGDRR